MIIIVNILDHFSSITNCKLDGLSLMILANSQINCVMNHVPVKSECKPCVECNILVTSMKGNYTGCFKIK